MTKDEALKLALKFVEDTECGTADLEAHIKEALAQPEQEPVAWLNKERNTIIWDKLYPDMDALYTTPPKRTWVGLTDEEIQVIAKKARSKDHAVTLTNKFLKEKNL